MHSKKDVRRLNHREDYEKNGFEGVMNDLNKDKKEALDYVPEKWSHDKRTIIRRKQK